MQGECAETEKPALWWIQLVRDIASSLCLPSPARFSPPLNRDVRGGRRRPVAGVLPVDTVGSTVAAERWGGRTSSECGRQVIHHSAILTLCRLRATSRTRWHVRRTWCICPEETTTCCWESERGDGYNVLSCVCLETGDAHY